MAVAQSMFPYANTVIFLQLGAAAVNLVAGDKPADVYSGIASRLLHFLPACLIVWRITLIVLDFLIIFKIVRDVFYVWKLSPNSLATPYFTK